MNNDKMDKLASLFSNAIMQFWHVRSGAMDPHNRNLETSQYNGEW